jgi:hypothetical protein
MVSNKKKWTVMNPIRRQMKKRNPSSGQNGQLVHWWLLVHSGRIIWGADTSSKVPIACANCLARSPFAKGWGPAARIPFHQLC